MENPDMKKVDDFPRNHKIRPGTLLSWPVCGSHSSDPGPRTSLPTSPVETEIDPPFLASKKCCFCWTRKGYMYLIYYIHIYIYLEICLYCNWKLKGTSTVVVSGLYPSLQKWHPHGSIASIPFKIHTVLKPGEGVKPSHTSNYATACQWESVLQCRNL